MRLNPLIRLWTGRELVVAGLMVVLASVLLVTADYDPSAPYLGRWLALSFFLLWICALCTWLRRHIISRHRL